MKQDGAISAGSRPGTGTEVAGAGLSDTVCGMPTPQQIAQLAAKVESDKMRERLKNEAAGIIKKSVTGESDSDCSDDYYDEEDDFDGSTANVQFTNTQVPKATIDDRRASRKQSKFIIRI